MSHNQQHTKESMPRSAPSHPIRVAAIWMLKLPVHFYRYFISPLLGPKCRFQPTCSQYALDALEIHGPIRGSWLALRRILRCHPFGGHGYDPVPEKNKNKTEHTGSAPVNSRAPATSFSSHPPKLGRL